MVSLGDRKPTPKEDRIAIANRVVHAFTEISNETVRNAFSKCGF